MLPLAIGLVSLQGLQALEPARPPKLAPLVRTTERVRIEAEFEPAVVARSVLGPLELGLVAEQPPSLACPRRVVLEQLVDGVPVHGGFVRVNSLRDGTALLVSALRDPGPVGGAVLLDADAAAALAAAAMPAESGPRVQRVRLEVLPLAAGARFAWRADIAFQASSALARTIWLDASNGLELGSADAALHADGKGHVFLPNAVQYLGDPNLVDDRDSAKAVPEAAYIPVALRDLDGSGYLTGPWATTAETKDRVRRPNLDFSSTRAGDVFEEVMAYYHADAYQRYLQSLRLTANARQQPFDVHDRLYGYEYAGASYNLVTKVIACGTLGVDMAEDADIVVHEYGHAIHDDVQGGTTLWTENHSMSEGYGDWFACSYFDDVAFGDWAGTNPDLNGGGAWPYLRRVDVLKHYPADLGQGPHLDGQIWSGALWELALMVGRDVATTLVVEGMAMQTPYSTMAEGASFLLLADDSLYGGSHRHYLEGALRRRGLVPVPPEAANLAPEVVSVQAGGGANASLESPLDPGAEYVLVLASRAAPSFAGRPYNVQLDIDPDVFWGWPAASGLSGYLDASGRARFWLPVPEGYAPGRALYVQALVLGARRAAVRLSAPVALRVEAH